MAIVNIHTNKEVNGEAYSNVWTAIIDGAGSGFPTDLQVMNVVGPPVTDASTDPLDALFQGLINLLHAIIAFERLLASAEVIFTSVYVTDGKKQVGEAANTFYAQVLDGITGSLAGSGEDLMAPGSTTLMLARSALGLGSRGGRIFLRASLKSAEVDISGFRLMGFRDNTQRDAVIARVAAAKTDSGLELYLGSTPGPSDVNLAVAHYYNGADVDQVGNLVSAQFMSSIVVRRPANRQVQKGRKRPA